MLTALRKIIENARLAAERRRTAHELLRLSDYLLTDVGLRRRDLELTASGLAPGIESGAMGPAPTPILVPQQALLRVRAPTMQGCG